MTAPPPPRGDTTGCTGGRRGPTNNEISRSRAWCQSQGVEQESGSPASGQRGGAARQRQLQPSLTYSKRRQRQRRTDPAYSPTQDACDAWTTSQVLGVGARDKFSPREPTSTKITRPARGVARGCTVFDVRLLDAVSKKKSNHVSFVASKRIELPPRPPSPTPRARTSPSARVYILAIRETCARWSWHSYHTQYTHIIRVSRPFPCEQPSSTGLGHAGLGVGTTAPSGS